MTRLAVFDCDGTLIDGQASICQAMERAFAEAGLPAPDRHQIRRMVGLSLPQAMRKLVPDIDEELQRAAVDAYKRAFRAQREAGELLQPLFDGIVPLIDALHGAGWQLAVATGMSRRGLDHCLA
ncbi:MAG: HAD hydrolase-like protein, partial [Sphingomonadales bacterium]|nr:HAD hydrolase-like protein [Sphingomonadales bacterium]